VRDKKAELQLIIVAEQVPLTEMSE